MGRRLFISYSHHDADILGELRVHLRPLERGGVIEPWFDSYLVPGDDFDREVRRALAASDFIGLLVTPRFLASDYCVDVEMEDAVARHQAGQARVVPIIAKPCGWKTTYLTKLLATPKDGIPISKWPDHDEAWDNVAQDLAKAAQAAHAPSAAAKTSPRMSPSFAPAAGPPSEKASTASSARRAPFGVPRSIKPTDRDFDDYRHAAFETIAEAFEASIVDLDGNVSGRFRRLDANRFIATLYLNGRKVAGCTIYTGSGHFGASGIAYNGSDSGDTNSMNEDLTVQASENGLVLKPLMGRMSGRTTEQLMTPEEAAGYLWSSFTDRLHL